MPPLSELPDDISRERFLRALERLGFTVSTRGGKGSHAKAVWPRNQKAAMVQKGLPKYVLKYLLKQIEEISGVTWDDIAQEL